MALTPRTALVTGAASGIGAALAQRLAGAGLRVIGADRTPFQHPGVEAIELDLADTAAVGRMSQHPALAESGLDVLVNCAGVYASTPIDGFDAAGYARILNVNLTGALALTAAVLPLLDASDSPRVLNISSVQAWRGEAGSLAYGISKAGLAHATRVLAVELAPRGILVNALAPGFIETPMATLADGTSEHDGELFQQVYVGHARLPLRRPGTSDEVAAAAEFFVSTHNTYVTGQVLAVDGGLTAAL